MLLKLRACSCLPLVLGIRCALGSSPLADIIFLGVMASIGDLDAQIARLRKAEKLEEDEVNSCVMSIKLRAKELNMSADLFAGSNTLCKSKRNSAHGTKRALRQLPHYSVRRCTRAVLRFEGGSRSPFFLKILSMPFFCLLIFFTSAFVPLRLFLPIFRPHPLNRACCWSSSNGHSQS